MKNKKIIITIILLLILIIGGFISYKIYILNKYDITKIGKSMKNDSQDEFEAFLLGLENKDTWKITSNILPEDEYFTFEDLKIKNIFTNFKKEDQLDSLLYPYVRYSLYDENGKKKSSIALSKYYNYLSMFQEESVSIFGISEKESNKLLSINRKKYLQKKNITTDLELFDFLEKNKNYKPNIFTSINDIKGQYAIHFFANIIIPKIKSITILEGDYQGYILNVNEKIKEISILQGTKKYNLLLGNIELTTDELHQLLNTIVIKQK